MEVEEGEMALTVNNAYDHKHGYMINHEASQHNHIVYTNPTNINMMMVRYRECLKNHAATIGGHATDGCGEFMPLGEENTLEALTCSACNCHRNFHRKEIEGRNVILQGHHHMGVLGPESCGYPQANQMIKKRFRTKFTQEQKEKMLSFAEKVGWKIQKQEESEVQQFCQELGIKRRVLKVWMHNNKHNLAKNINSNPPNQII